VASEREPGANRRAPYAIVAVGFAFGAWMIWGRSQGPSTTTVSPVPAPSASVTAPPPEPRAPEGPSTYVFPPDVRGQNLPNGHYQTEVRFRKTAGAWPADQESKFDLWFDGNTQKEFTSRGFESPVNFDVKTPEPRHLSIRIMTPPLDAAGYVVFIFKSPKPIQLLRSSVTPAIERDAATNP